MAGTRGMLAGNFRAWAAKRDSNGYMLGQASDPESPTNNTVYTPHVIDHLISFGAPAIERIIARAIGGESQLGQRILGTGGIDSFPLELAFYDEIFVALANSTSVDETTLTGVNITAPNSGDSDPRNLHLGVNMGYTDSDGNQHYATIMYNSVQIGGPAGVSGNQGGGDNPNALSYEVTPRRATRTVPGELYSTMSLSVEDNSDLSIVITGSKQYFVETYVANGVATTYTLTYLPTSSTVDGSVNWQTVNGTQTNPSSINTSTGVVTLAAAGSDGDIVSIAYQTDFVAV